MKSLSAIFNVVVWNVDVTCIGMSDSVLLVCLLNPPFFSVPLRSSGIESLGVRYKYHVLIPSPRGILLVHKVGESEWLLRLRWLKDVYSSRFSLPGGRGLWNMAGLINHTDLGLKVLFLSSLCCIESASHVCLSIIMLNTMAGELSSLWKIFYCSTVILGEFFDLLCTWPGVWVFFLFEIMKGNCILLLMWFQSRGFDSPPAS